MATVLNKYPLAALIEIDGNTIDKALNAVETGTELIEQGAEVADLAGGAGKTITELISQWPMAASGIVLVIIAVFIWFFLKRVLENTVLGLATLGVIYFMFPDLFAQLEPQLLVTLAATMVFGVGGIGTMLLFIWLGII